MSTTDKFIVYHGTTSLFDVIDVSLGKPYKDFGRGFYVTKSKDHATKPPICWFQKDILGFLRLGYEPFHLTGNEGILEELDSYVFSAASVS